MNLNTILRIFIVLLCCQLSFSQVPKTRKDSTEVVYKKIEEKSNKTKTGKFFYKLIFKNTEVKSESPRHKTRPTRKFDGFDSKIIRKIYIKTLDPFGYSVTDTTSYPKRFLSKAGNVLHIKTQNIAIRNLLLIKKNQPLDTLLLRESERLVRSQRYIRRVIIEPRSIPNNPDSVDVYVTALDSWSLIPNGSASSNRTTIELTERNFLGTGHEWDNTFRQNLNDNKKAFSTRYTIPNIVNTYIRTSLNYQIDLDDNYTRSIAVERPFYSPYARWAGGILVETRFQQDSLPDANQNYSYQNFKYNTHDFWAGHSIAIFKESKEFKRNGTNLITAVRFLNTRYTEKPNEIYDTIQFYSGRKLIIGSIGLSTRKFVQDSYIFNYGIIEDVPIGKYYGFTGGYESKNGDKRFYAGLRATLGNYFKWGYFSTNYEYGTYFRGPKSEQTAFTIQVNYFTPLFEPGKWKIRQFFRSEVVLGGNRLNTVGDLISINGDSGIQGFNSPKLLGTKKIIFMFQTQSYSPWDLSGFRFSPYINYSFGILGNSKDDFSKSKGFSKIGLGVIISNDYLVFNSFQFSLAYYPSIPFEGSNLFKTNTFKTSDFGYLDFEINKPRTVLYE